MSDMQIQQVLSEMRRLSASVGPENAQAGNVGQAGGPTATGFANALQNSLQQVNAAQHEAGDLATAFQLGDPQVSLSQVMLAGQKASIGFEATVQVRNRLLSAYQEIMNMQV